MNDAKLPAGDVQVGRADVGQVDVRVLELGNLKLGHILGQKFIYSNRLCKRLFCGPSPVRSLNFFRKG